MALTYLTEADVKRLVDVKIAIPILERAFIGLALGEAENIPRARAKAQGIVLHSMSAAANYLGFVGWKQYTTTREGARFLVGLYQQTDGKLEALMEADLLGQIRTGAASGVAIRHLALPDVEQVGVIGCGWQARSQLAAAAAARPIRTATVYCRNAQRREQFAKEMAEELEIEVQPVDSAEQAVRDQPIVITMTSSSTPVIRADWIAEGCLVCAAGSNWLHKAELDPDTIKQADLIVCDSVDACRVEAGDLHRAEQAGWDWSQAMELSKIVEQGPLPSRAAQQRIVFKSVGLALEDVALGAEVLRRYFGTPTWHTL